MFNPPSSGKDQVVVLWIALSTIIGVMVIAAGCAIATVL